MKALACFTESKAFKDLCAKSGNPAEFTRIYLKNKDDLKTKITHVRFCELLCDMNCQLGDLREFARTDFEFNKSYFYDFCLKPLKIIVEYNGIYFHPRNREDWRRKDLTFDEALAKDLRKISFIEDLGYKVFVIWEDDDIEIKINEVINYAKAQLDKR